MTTLLICPNHASRHYIQELYDELIVATFLSRWALHLRVSQFLLSISTHQGKLALSHMQATLLDVLNQAYPRWQSHQIYPYNRTADLFYGHTTWELRQHGLRPPHDVRTADSHREP